LLFLGKKDAPVVDNDTGFTTRQMEIVDNMEALVNERYGTRRATYYLLLCTVNAFENERLEMEIGERRDVTVYICTPSELAPE
jgi:hypothetical protein